MIAKLPRTLAIAVLTVGSAAAQPPGGPAAERSFVACPVYRDTNNGRKSGCWLATEPSSGVRYDVTLSRTKPQIGREILVEGRESGQADACGGVVLKPVHVSVLETTCPSFMLPAEGFLGRRYEVPAGLVLPPADAVRTSPPPPYPARTWAIEFSFGSSFLEYQYSEVILDGIAQYVLASHPRAVAVTGFAAARPWIVSGHRLAEDRGLAKTRARLVAEALGRLGVSKSILQVSWRADPAAKDIDDGIADPSKRRVEVTVSY